MVVHQSASPPKDQFDTKQGNEQGGQDADASVTMTSSEIEQIIMNHSHEAIVNFIKQVDALSLSLDGKLKLREESVHKVVDGFKADLKSINEHL